MEHWQVSLTVQACYTKGCTHAMAAPVDTYVGTYTYATACHLRVVGRALEGYFHRALTH